VVLPHIAVGPAPAPAPGPGPGPSVSAELLALMLELKFPPARATTFAQALEARDVYSRDQLVAFLQDSGITTGKGLADATDNQITANAGATIVRAVLALAAAPSPASSNFLPPVSPAVTPTGGGGDSVKWRKDVSHVLLGGTYWLVPASVRPGSSGTSVLANAYLNGPQQTAYKLKLAAADRLEILQREKAALERVAALAGAEALVVQCLDLEGPIAHPAVLGGAPCHMLVLEAGQVDLREALKPQLYGEGSAPLLAPGNGTVSRLSHDGVCSRCCPGQLFGGRALTCLPVITSVLEAVQVINRAGLVWRDAKPEVGHVSRVPPPWLV
jgi:hypothetical protein